MERIFYCINLKSRGDRKEKMQKTLDHLGIRAIFPNVEKDPRGGKYGCRDSHMRIWREAAIRYPDSTIVIFEDDADYIVEDPSIFWKSLREAEDVINRGETEMVNFGGMFLRKGYQITKNICRGIRTSLLCYVSKGSILGTLKDRFYSHQSHIDLEIMLSCNLSLIESPLFRSRDVYDSNNEWVDMQGLDSVLKGYQERNDGKPGSMSSVSSYLALASMMVIYLSDQKNICEIDAALADSKHEL